MHNRVFNLERSKLDLNDYKILRAPVCLVDLPKVVNLAPLYEEYADQLQWGFCWSFTMTGLQADNENFKNPNARHNFSPLNFAKITKQSEYTEYPATEGESIRAALKVAQKLPSIVPEDLMPYSLYKGGLVFPDKVVNYPDNFKIGSYYACANSQEMKVALASGFRIVLGILCCSNILEGDHFDAPTGSWLGFHAIRIDGYDDNTGYFTFPNSWGRKWGNNGRGYISYEYIDGVMKDIAIPWSIDRYAVVDYLQLNRANTIVLTMDQKEALVDGVLHILDQSPIMTAAGRAMVPVRFISEYLGYAVDWSAPEKKITILGDNTNIVLHIDSPFAQVNGVTQTLDQAPYVSTETWRTMVPLRFISEQLGFIVNWNDLNKTITIIRK